VPAALNLTEVFALLESGRFDLFRSKSQSI